MRSAIDLTGRTFERLTVLERVPADRPKWRCHCSCGNETVSYAGNLKAGTAKSCGCIRDDLARKRMTKHGQHQTPEYEVWAGARYRCANPQHQAYRNYGARGISMCERWRASFEAFLSDMGRRPTPQHTLERIRNDGPYSPDNCRWALMRDQARNTRANRVVEFGGKRMVLMDWSKELGIHYETLRGRLNRWKSVERAFTAPVAR